MWVFIYWCENTFSGTSISEKGPPKAYIKKRPSVNKVEKWSAQVKILLRLWINRAWLFSVTSKPVEPLKAAKDVFTYNFTEYTQLALTFFSAPFMTTMYYVINVLRLNIIRKSFDMVLTIAGKPIAICMVWMYLEFWTFIWKTKKTTIK